MNNFPNSKDSVPSTSSNNAIQTFTSVLTSGPSTIDLDNEKFTQSKLISIKTPMDFYFIKMIGEGAFSTVYLAREVNSDRESAIKVLSKNEIRREGKIRYVIRENNILVSISNTHGGHPFVVKIFYAFQDSERFYFAFSFAKNGELLEILKRLGSFDEESTLFYTSEILSALEFLHIRCRIIHRDLKPENILVGADWHIMLSDFGSAKMMEEPSSDNDLPSPKKSLITSTSPTLTDKQRNARSSFVGTAHYISPEVLKSEEAGPECDYWALGAIVFQMISGQPPFRAVNEYKILKKILDLQFQFPDGFPQTPKDLVSKLLVNKPTERLGSFETGGIKALKLHPFFLNVDWDTLPLRKPPKLKPYLPASAGEPAFYGDLSESKNEEEIPCDLEAGYEAAQIRLMGFGKKDFSEFNHELGNSSVDKATMENIVQQKRQEQLDKQRREHKYHRFVEGNLILKSGLIDKKKGLFARRRMFLLTEGPHLYYVDPNFKGTMILKGEIKFYSSMRAEAKNFRTFFIHTPNRTYYLFDPERHAKEWCDAIDWVKNHYFRS